MSYTYGNLRTFTQTRLIIKYKLTALTKLILAIMISIASLITNDLYILSILALIEIFTCFYLPKTKLLWSALGILIFFSFILFLIQLVCGTDLNTSIASALKMFIMAVLFWNVNTENFIHFGVRIPHDQVEDS